MKLPSSFTTITTLSKTLALLLFILFLLAGFYLGKQYQQSLQTPYGYTLVGKLDIQEDGLTICPNAAPAFACVKIFNKNITTAQPYYFFNQKTVKAELRQAYGKTYLKGIYLIEDNDVSSVTSTPPIPDNWKTYRNNEYEFQLNYPNEWKLLSEGSNDPGNSGTIQKDLSKIVFAKNNTPQLTITVLGQYNKDLSQKNFEKDYLSLGSDCDTRWGFILTKTTLIDLDNSDALEVIGDLDSINPSPPNQFKCIYARNPNQNLVVVSYSNSTVNTQLENQILSTFRFLDEDTTTKPTSAQSSCKQSGGTWIPQYNECEGVNQIQCEQIGGQFNECASPCRHDPNAQVCIEMCIPVCSL